MNLKSTFLFVLILASISAKTQTLSPDVPAYNWPYDSLIVYGDKGISSGLILGIETPHMGMKFYNRAIEIQPENPMAYERKAKAYLDYKMLDEATEAYTQCLDLDASNVKCVFGVFSISAAGTTRFQLGEVPQPMMKQVYNSAIAFLKVAPPEMAEDAAYAELLGYTFKLGIDNPEVYQKYIPIVLASKLDDRNYLLAEEILPAVQATNNNPVLANLYDKLSQYYFTLDNVSKTKEFGQKALATGYAYSTTYYYLGYTIYYDDKNIVEAIKILEEGLKKKGSYDRSSNLLATIQFNEGKAAYYAKNYTGAITYLNNYVNDYPESERANAYLGFAYYNAKKYTEAAKALKELKKLAIPATVDIYYPNLKALISFSEKPTATAPAIVTPLVEVEKFEAIYFEGEDLSAQRKFDEAILKYSEALAYFTTTNNKPKMELCYISLAICNHNFEKYDEAKSFYLKSIELGASDVSSYSNYALLLYAIDKNYVQAETILNNGLIRFPNNEAIINMQGKMYISQAYDFYDAKDYTTSITYFDKGLLLRDDARAYIYYGYAYSELGKTDDAVSAWSNAFILDAELATEFKDVYDYVQAKKQ